MSTSNFNGRIYLNPVPTEMMKPGAFFRVMRKYLQRPPNRQPGKPLGPFSVDLSVLNRLAPSDLRLTWLGHSTVVIESGGKRFLIDPVWYNRVSPFRYLGPQRFFANPLPLSSLPQIDAVLLSHDHYDHLDKGTVLQLCAKNIPVVTMLDVGKRLQKWGVNSANITELDWWQQHELAPGFIVTATPARHFSGRWINDRFQTLWGAFAVMTPAHNIFFGADSGYFDGFKTIGEKLGPFDVAMLEIGAYNEEWEAIHMGPENAVQATLDLGNPPLLPIHWGTFSLAMHAWTEPVERLLVEADRKSVTLLLPQPGETLTVNGVAYNSGWWKKTA